jgi:hypothetical protein
MWYHMHYVLIEFSHHSKIVYFIRYVLPERYAIIAL